MSQSEATAHKRCPDCGEPATHSPDSWQSAMCWHCVVSTMEHGHMHVHDYTEDCSVDCVRLDGTGTDTYVCPVPRTETY